MNIIFLLRPKATVAFLYDDSTIRQGLEKMRAHGYTAIPVITREGRYIGTVSEGDFLWHMVDTGSGGSAVSGGVWSTYDFARGLESAGADYGDDGGAAFAGDGTELCAGGGCAAGVYGNYHPAGRHPALLPARLLAGLAGRCGTAGEGTGLSGGMNI